MGWDGMVGFVGCIGSIGINRYEMNVNLAMVCGIKCQAKRQLISFIKRRVQLQLVKNLSNSVLQGEKD